MMNLKSCLMVLGVGLACLTCAGIGLSQTKDTLPQEVIKNMAERYAAVSSYQDTGVVETVSGDVLLSRSTDVFFKTYFTRPHKLRFEWADYSPFSSVERNVVWGDGGETFRFYSFDPNKIKAVENMGLALAGATGISRGSAHTVPNLLIKKRCAAFR